MSLPLEYSRAPFQTTEWTMFEVLCDHNHAHREVVLNQLTSRYWPPIYAWLRRFGLDRDHARDLTQSFFLHVILGRRLFELADSRQGRFRTLVRTALRHYVIDEHRKTQNATSVVSLTDELLQLEELHLDSVQGDEDEVFDRRWNLAMVTQALEIVEAQYCGADQAKYWKAYEAWVVRPSYTGNQRPNRESLAKQLGFANGSHLSVAVHNVKHRVRLILDQLQAHDDLCS